MSSSKNGLPQKTREFMNHHVDSSIWNDLVFRDDDVVIGSYAKSGTTWTQQIVSQLIFNGTENLDLFDMSPWLEFRVPPKDERLHLIESQTHRRFIKTHLPVDALIFSPKAKYVYIARDGRDVLWSLHNHHMNVIEDFYHVLNDTPGLVGPPFPRPVGSVYDYFLRWLDSDGYPWWPFWDNIRSWWEIRNLPNVLLVHYANLKSDMPGQIRQIADFLDIKIDENRWLTILDHCSFSYMKTHAARTLPSMEATFEGGAKAFIYKGSNGRWRDVLSAEDCRRYETKAQDELGEACANWLSAGKLVHQR